MLKRQFSRTPTRRAAIFTIIAMAAMALGYLLLRNLATMLSCQQSNLACALALVVMFALVGLVAVLVAIGLLVTALILVSTELRHYRSLRLPDRLKTLLIGGADLVMLTCLVKIGLTTFNILQLFK